jgi:ribonuclease HI
MAKPTSGAVTELLVDIAERYGLLPATHFGFRPGRTTTDAILLAEKFVRDAWRRGDVVSGLFLDVSGAFPSVHLPRLIHNLRSRGVPVEVTDWITAKLSDRSTTLSFDGFRSDAFPVLGGLDQGCPLSGILYIFYNAPVVELASPGERLYVAFADDVASFTAGRTFPQVRFRQRRDLLDDDGIDSWAVSHNCHFGVPKIQLVDFTLRTEPDPEHDGRRRRARGQAIHYRGHAIRPEPSAIWLGVRMQASLSWSEQWLTAIARAAKWSQACARVMRAKWGLTISLARQLFTTVCLPRVLYAAEVWAAPSRGGARRARRALDSTPTGVVARLAAALRPGILAVCGAMRTTALEVVEVHLNLLPIDLALELTRHRAAIRIATLPPSHPLHAAARDVAGSPSVRHRSALDILLNRHRLHPDAIETVDVVRRPPHWTPAFLLEPPPSREDAHIDELLHCVRDDARVYSDGSVHSGGVGAAAILIRRDGSRRELALHLGCDNRYIVYTAETVGLVLAAHLLRTEPLRSTFASIGVDNQAALTATARHGHGKGQWAVDVFRDLAEDFVRRGTELAVRWTPGHSNVDGNEAADVLAKAAAEGPHASSAPELLPPPLRMARLPTSASALRMEFELRLRDRHAARWRRSPRHAIIERIDDSLPSNSFLRLAGELPRRQAALLIRLRTGKAPLARHLWEIQAVDSLRCEECGDDVDETVKHYVLDCPAHEPARRALRAAVGPRKAGDLRFLLSDSRALPALLAYVDATARFAVLFGELRRLAPAVEG